MIVLSRTYSPVVVFHAVMTLRPFPILLLLALAVASPAAARAPTGVPAPADPVQFYVFSFTETPAAEATQDIVTGALARDLAVDPAVEGVVSFHTEGWSGSEALLNDFGTALLDQDIALMRTAPGAYTLIPRANVPMMLARGGVLMTLPEPATATPALPMAATAMAPAYGGERWWDSARAALLIFFSGALAGGVAVIAGWTVHYRALARPLQASTTLRLTDQRPAEWPVTATTPDPELVIPRFDRPSPDSLRRP